VPSSLKNTFPPPIFENQEKAIPEKLNAQIQNKAQNDIQPL